MYLQKKKQLLEQEPLLIIVSNIFYGEKKSIFEWSEELFLNERTLFSYLKKLIPLLEDYNLKISYEPELLLIGNEIDIRNFFFTLFYEEDTLPHFILPSTLIDTIVSNLYINILDNLDTTVPYFKLSFLLQITYQRLSLGYGSEINDEVIKTLQMNSACNDIMKEVKITFEKITQISLSDSDLAYLIVMLLDMQSYSKNFSQSIKLETVLLPLAVDLCDELGFLRDSQTVETITNYFHLYYLKNQTSPTCLFLPKSLIEYLDGLYSNELNTINNLLIGYPEGFWNDTSAPFGYNLLLTTLRLNYKNKAKRFTLAFLFEGPTEIISMLEELTRVYIPTIHKVYFLHTCNSLDSDIKRLSIDLVITNFLEIILSLPDDVDSILFHYIPTAEDWNTLVNYIDPRLSNKYKTILHPDKQI